MPYFASSQEWLEQSLRLIKARPSTTRTTTRYSSVKAARQRAAKPSDGDSEDATKPPPKPSRACLVLKTYDPVSGITLKYRTTKAAEVSRLVYVFLGRIGRAMAAVPDDLADDPMPHGLASNQGVSETKPTGAPADTPKQPPQQQLPAASKRKKRDRK